MTAPFAVGISAPPGAAAAAVGGEALGTYAKSATPPLLPPAPDGREPIRAARAERYALLSTARGLLSAAGRRAGLVYGHDHHRTAKCKFIRHGGDSVGVHRERESGGAFYANLVTCGSVWSCPVCAAVVQERRREEIATAVDWAYEQCLQPMLVTLTFPHRAWHKLEQLLDQQADALHRLRAGAPWTRWKKRAGFRGLIRSLELTHGDNGWHPHTHELWFVSPKLSAADARATILARWETSCARAGLLDLADKAQVAAFRAHAVDVKPWCSASDYLAKQDDSRHWGVDREVAKASSKAGRKSGVHPFGLLALASDGDSRAGQLYVEFTEAMKGRRQHFWSHGLKDLVGIEDQSDEELAEERRARADLLGQLDDDDWRTVREANARAQVLDAAEVGGWPAVRELLERLTLAEVARLEALLAAGEPTSAASAPGLAASAAARTSCRLAEMLAAAQASACLARSPRPG